MPGTRGNREERKKGEDGKEGRRQTSRGCREILRYPKTGFEGSQVGDQKSSWVRAWD